MIDLQSSSGLPIKFDEVGEKIHFGEEVICGATEKVPLRSMLPGLLNKTLKYPENVYLEYKNIHHRDDHNLFDKKNYKYDIVMLPAGVMGVEFIRSHIFYNECRTKEGQLASHKAKVSEIVEVLSGNLTILLQRNEPKESELQFETRVSEGLVVRMKRGEKFTVPRGYYYTFINTKDAPVVFSRFYVQGCVCDYSALKREQGLAYFAIRKNAKQEFVYNPRYRDIPSIKITPKQLIMRNVEIDDQEPLYAQVRKKEKNITAYF